MNNPSIKHAAIGVATILAPLAMGTAHAAYLPFSAGSCLAMQNGVISAVSSIGGGGPGGNGAGQQVTGTSYTIVAADGCTDVIFNSATANLPVTLPRSTTPGFGYGWSFNAINQSTTKSVVITPTTSSFPNGAASLTMPPNSQCVIGVDGTGNNYYFGECSAINSSLSAVTSGSGDVNFTGPGIAATTIQPGVVTNAKLAQPPALSLIGNGTNATAAASYISCTVGTVGVILTNSSGTTLICGTVGLNTNAVSGTLPGGHGGTNSTTLVQSAPTGTSGLPGTGPSFITSNTALDFVAKVGTGGMASTGSVSFSYTATTGWGCHIEDLTTLSASVWKTVETGYTTTSVNFGNYTSAASSGPWNAGDYLFFTCMPF